MINAIIKTLYLKPLYETNQNGRISKVREDALLYVVGDNSGNRELKILQKPKYTFYLAKKPLGYHRLSVPIDDLIPITCNYSDRFEQMADSIGLKSEYIQAKKDWMTKREWIQQNLYNNSQLYFADNDIEDVFKMNFIEKSGDHATDLTYTSGFTDIEVRADLGDFNQHMAEVPICSICHLDAKSETIYVVVVNDPKVPMIKEVFNNLGEYVNNFRKLLKEIRNECIEEIIKHKSNPELVHSFNFNFKFFLMDNEKDLIIKYFDIIKELKPDFVGIWNINYDMIMIKNRAAKLGLNMADLISNNIISPEYRYFDHVEDKDRYDSKKQTHYSRYFDKIFSSSITQWYCQMSLHSNLRKRFLEKDYKLGTIGSKYAYIKKLDLESKGYHVSNVYVKNFKVFLDYAIIDPIVQFMIERMNNDIPRYMINCRNTKFFNGIKKTYGIKNDLCTFLKYTKNEIVGNNKSYDIVEAIPGAIIASPNNIARKGIELLGVKTHIYRNAVDFDIASEYPTLLISYNILKTTIYGRIINVYIKKDIGNEMIVNIPISDGTTFNKMIQTIDTAIFDIGQKYFALPSIDQLLTHIEKICKK